MHKPAQLVGLSRVGSLWFKDRRKGNLLSELSTSIVTAADRAVHAAVPEARVSDPTDVRFDASQGMAFSPDGSTLYTVSDCFGDNCKILPPSTRDLFVFDVSSLLKSPIENGPNYKALRVDSLEVPRDPNPDVHMELEGVTFWPIEGIGALHTMVYQDYVHDSSVSGYGLEIFRCAASFLSSCGAVTEREQSALFWDIPVSVLGTVTIND